MKNQLAHSCMHNDSDGNELLTINDKNHAKFGAFMRSQNQTGDLALQQKMSSIAIKMISNIYFNIDIIAIKQFNIFANFRNSLC